MKLMSRWIGCCVLLLAFALFTAIVINPMRLGGNVWGGKVENGRYYVIAKGHRYTEVSKTEWQIERVLEWSFLLPLPLVWTGLAFLAAAGIGKKPVPAPTDPPLMWPYFVGIGFTALGAVAGWLIGGVPWTAFFGAWLAVWSSVAAIVWLQYRFMRQQSNSEQPASADAGVVSVYPNSSDVSRST